MSVQSDLFALLKATFSDRLYPGIAPAATPTPYATYSRVSAVEQVSLDANGGTGNATNTRIQIDVWSLTYAEAQAKAAAVKAALKGWSVENVALSEQDMFEPDIKLHRVMIDISTWHM